MTSPTTIRIPARVKAALQSQAKREERTVSYIIIRALTAYVDSLKGKK